MDNNEQKKFFYKIFDASLPRLAPGDDNSTKRAIDILLSNKPNFTKPECENLKILDIGCGNGAQTIQLAKYFYGTILAVDNHKPYLDELERRSEIEGVSDKIKLNLKDMCDLGLVEGSFDIVWFEGALYIIGFRDGLTLCHNLLVQGGLMAVSELSWLLSNPPEECREFFSNEYPAMVNVDSNIATIKNCGFDLLGHFTLHESAWKDSYYNPLENWLKLFRKKYTTDSDRLNIIDSVQIEIDIYNKYYDYYGYVFFCNAKKVSHSIS